jgi:hypothetical protein
MISAPMFIVITKLHLRWNISQDNRWDRPTGRGIKFPGQEAADGNDASVDRRPQTAPHCLFVDRRSALACPKSMTVASEPKHARLNVRRPVPRGRRPRGDRRTRIRRGAPRNSREQLRREEQRAELDWTKSRR